MMAWRPTSLKAMACALSRAVDGHGELAPRELGKLDREEQRGHPAHRAADDGVELRDSQVVEQELLRVHHVADGDERELRAVGRGRSRDRSSSGPVEPWQPPSTLAQTTKKRRVSTALPGPIRLFHQPGLASASECQPAQWWSPLSAWQMRTALSRVALSGAVGLVAQREARDHLAALEGEGPRVGEVPRLDNADVVPGQVPEIGGRLCLDVVCHRAGPLNRARAATQGDAAFMTPWGALPPGQGTLLSPCGA